MIKKLLKKPRLPTLPTVPFCCCCFGLLLSALGSPLGCRPSKCPLKNSLELLLSWHCLLLRDQSEQITESSSRNPLGYKSVKPGSWPGNPSKKTSLQRLIKITINCLLTPSRGYQRPPTKYLWAGKLFWLISSFSPSRLSSLDDYFLPFLAFSFIQLGRLKRRLQFATHDS